MEHCYCRPLVGTRGAPRRARRNATQPRGVYAPDHHPPDQPDGATAWNADLRSARAVLRTAHVATLASLTAEPPGTGPATATCSNPTDSASAACSSPTTAYCDMYPPSRLRQCYMFLPEDGLLRHVPAQPTPPQLHVPPRRPPTATCTRPADTARATCSSPRTGYCDMYPASRLCQRYMFLPEDRLMRHVPGQPTPLALHVPPRGSATATCNRPADSASAACSSRRTRQCDMYPASRLR